jgi:RecA-family ATPase
MPDAIDAAKAAIDAKLGSAKNGKDEEAPLPSPLRIIDPRDLQGKPVPARRWIVPDWIPVGYVTALYGPGGIGKSLLALQLMVATALGKPWLGLHVEQGPSLGFFCEDDEDELHRRLANINHQLYGCQFTDLGAMRYVPRLGDNNLLMVPHPKWKHMVPTKFFEQVCDEARTSGAQLIVIDTVADTFGGNQNDAGQVRQYVQYGLARLARTLGDTAVLACAHPSRAGINAGSGESGSVQWDAVFRSRHYLQAPTKGDGDLVDPDARVLTRKKANYAAREETVELRWHDGVISRASETMTEGERASAETVFLTILEKMTAEGQSVSHNTRAGNYAPKEFVKRPGRQRYQIRDFARAMQALFEMGEIRIEEYGKPSHRLQKIVRAVREETPF